MALSRAAAARALGAEPPGHLAAAVGGARAGSIADTPALRVLAVHTGPVLCLDLDAVDERYLLAVDTKARVALYDLAQPTAPSTTPTKPLASYSGPPPPSSSTTGSASAAASVAGHGGAVSSVQWYPVDTGLFVTGGFDSRVVAWDANSFQPAFSWPLDGSVYSLAASPVAGHHALVAAATADPRVRLIDLSTCGYSHTLVGHTDAVLTVAWCPAHEFLLASGSRDGTVRLWDVRRSGGSACLTQLDVHRERRLPAAPLPGQGQQPRTAAALAAAAAAAAVAGREASTSTGGSASASAVTQFTSHGGGRAHIGGVNALAWSPPSHPSPPLLVSSGADSSAQRWEVDLTVGGGAVPSASGADLLTGDPLVASAFHSRVTYPGVKNSFRHALHPLLTQLDGRGGRKPLLLFVPCSDGTIVAYDAASGDVEGVLRGHQAVGGGVNALAFRRASQQLISAGDDGMIGLWSSELLAAGRAPLSPRED